MVMCALYQVRIEQLLFYFQVRLVVVFVQSLPFNDPVTRPIIPQYSGQWEFRTPLSLQRLTNAISCTHRAIKGGCKVGGGLAV
jgi:hypothetical protein